MYNTQIIADLIKKQAKLQNKQIKDVLTDCDLNKNTIAELAKGKQLSSIRLAKIADYLDCSVDYLLGRTKDPSIANRFPDLTDDEWSKVEAFVTGLIANRK